MDWHDLLAACDAGLDALEDRLARAAAGQGPAPVRYAPGQVQAGPDECLIGVGRHLQDGVPADHAGICLNDKGLPEAVTARRAVGVTALALAPPPRLWARWQQAVGAQAQPAAFLGRFTLVVEDASPDSCLGLIVLLARLCGVPPAAIPADWTRYAAAWEQGETRTADPYRAWGPLASALAHAHFDPSALQHAAPDSPSALNREQAVGQAWVAGLRLTLAALAAGSPPEPLAPLPACPELGQATAALRAEEQVYRQAIDQAARLQLRLPLAGPGGRWRLVDACLLEEFAPTGAMKVFLRNDRERAWLGDGFGLFALHRPALAGSGYELTVSVDPATGTRLQALWERLETLEDQAGPRDASNPRLVAGYPGGRRPDGRPSPTEPWWDDRGSFTLVAAPRRLPDGSPGTRLTWPQVLEALWDCYRPDRGLQFVGADGVLRPLFEHQPEPLRDTDRYKLLLRWPPPEMRQEPPLLTPTLQRLLAAGILGRDGLAHLPPLEALDLLPLPGGLAVVHGSGVLLLDDWCSEALCKEEIDMEIAQVVERLRFDRAEGERARGLIDEIGRRIAAGRLPRKRDLHALAGLRLQLRFCLDHTAPACDDARLQRLREALERRWGTAARLGWLDRSLGDLDAALGAAAAQRTARLVNGLTILGFPLVLFAGFFQFVLADLPRDWAAALHWLQGAGAAATPAPAAGPHWPGLALYAVLSALGMLAIWLATRFIGSGFKGRRPEQPSDGAVQPARRPSADRLPAPGFGALPGEPTSGTCGPTGAGTTDNAPGMARPR